MDKLHDFDSCKEGLKRYGGSDKKETIYYNGKRYMLKYNELIDSDKRNELASSSRNNAFSEYVCCHIFESLGIPVQNTLLGTRKGHIVVACEDFCKEGYELNEFIKYGNSIDIAFEDQRYPEIMDVLEVIRRNKHMNPQIIEERFWDTLVVDAILGNFDRHTGNWGYLYNEEEQFFDVAPVYDCGACLYAMVSDYGMEEILKSQEMIDERIYKFPKSAFQFKGIKVNYVDFLLDKEVHEQFPLLVKSIKKIYEKYDNDKVESIIDNTPEISPIRRAFYKRMLNERYNKILIPAIETIREKEEYTWSRGR